MDKNKFWLGGRPFNTASPRLGAPTQRKACPQVGHPNATQGTSASWSPQRTSAMQTQLTSVTQGTSARPQLGRPNATEGTSASWASPRLGAPTQRKACPQVGHPNATQGEFARWAPKRKTHLQRKCPHKGALGKKTSWRMDKNKFWLGGRHFNTTSPRLGAPKQRMARPKTGAQTQRKAHLQDGRPK
jgi:hypothetical protein